MPIAYPLLHDAVLLASNIQDHYISSFFHCEVNKRKLLLKVREPYLRKGNYCFSYQLWRNGDDSSKRPEKCLRVWHADVDINSNRYKIITEGLLRAKLPYFIKFKFVERGLKVGNEFVPIILMDWIDGQTLTEWLPEHKVNVGRIREVAFNFKDMCIELNELGIAHGDLASENILINSRNEIKLVDYDSIFMPEMGSSFAPMTNGWPAFQHPGRRDSACASAKDDYFSQHIIYVSLLTYSVMPELIGESAQTLLFEDSDLTNADTFIRSRNYKNVMDKCRWFGEIGKTIKNELDIIEHALKGKFDDVPPLRYEEPPMPELTPAKRLVNFCTICGADLRNTDYKYCIHCGAKRVEY